MSGSARKRRVLSILTLPRDPALVCKSPSWRSMSENWAFPNDNLRHTSISEYYWEKPVRKACDQGETWTQEAKLVAAGKAVFCICAVWLL